MHGGITDEAQWSTIWNAYSEKTLNKNSDVSARYTRKGFFVSEWTYETQTKRSIAFDADTKECTLTIEYVDDGCFAELVATDVYCDQAYDFSYEEIEFNKFGYTLDCYGFESENTMDKTQLNDSVQQVNSLYRELPFYEVKHAWKSKFKK